MAMEVRALAEDEFDAFDQTLQHAFHGDSDESQRQHLRDRLEFPRAFAAFDGDQLVGTGGAFSLALTVPGGASLPTGGTTLIGVKPTHQRQGVLRAMMDYHLDEVASRDEPLAGLWASDSRLYGRYGYGPATHRLELEIDRVHAEFGGEAPPGRVDIVSPEAALGSLRSIYDPVASRRPGMFSRDERWWRQVVLHDPESGRDGYGAKRWAVYTEGDEPLGYAVYKPKEHWERGHGANTVRVQEMVTATVTARAALWRFMCSMNLVAVVDTWNVPVDEELHWLLLNPRRVHTVQMDGLWLRVMDVPTALSARRYRVPGRLVFAVADAAFPAAAGVYELDADRDGAECKPSDADPELQLDAMALGAIYLGGASTHRLAAAGHIHAAPDVVERVELMFSWPEAPWCQEVF